MFPRLITIISVIFALSLAGAAQARQQIEWKKLGERQVAFRVDRDTISVGGDKGTFARLHLKAYDADVFVKSMTVYFGNGTKRLYTVNKLLRKGVRTDNIDLRGDRRRIKRIELVYRSRPGSGAKSRVAVFGDVLVQGYSVLGTQEVGRRKEHLIFDVGANAGGFEGIRLKALDRPLRVRWLDITFANGSTQRVKFGRVLEEFEQTRLIDFKGEGRFVRKIDVTIRPPARKPGRLRIYGKNAPKPKPIVEIPRGWVKFGERTVAFKADRDVIKVGREAGWFKRIALRARDNDIFVRQVTIVYGNGQKDVYPVNRELARNSRTPALDLKGGNRRIDRIEFLYRSDRNRRGRATMEVFGEHSDAWRNRPKPIVEIPRGWVKFGERTVDFRADRDVISIGKDAGWFKSIALRARDNDIFVRQVTIVYGNGQKEVYQVNRELPRNSRTPALDLKGGDRRIDRIEFLYRSERNRSGRATMEVFGEHSEAWNKWRRDHAGWKLLGSQSAGLLQSDTDVFPVGRSAGRFKSIRVSARNRDVRMYGMQIVYGNGTVENVPIYGTLAAGQTTQPFDLEGKTRFIKHIAFRYRTKLNFKGLGTVELWGRH